MPLHHARKWLGNRARDYASDPKRRKEFAKYSKENVNPLLQPIVNFAAEKSFDYIDAQGTEGLAAIMDGKLSPMKLRGDSTISQAGGSISKSKYTAKYKRSRTKKVLNMADRVKTKIVSSYGLQVLHDKQGVCDMTCCIQEAASRPFMYAIAHGGLAANTPFAQLFAMLNNSTGLGVGQQNSKILLESAQVRTTMSNFTANNIVADLYECVKHHDLGATTVRPISPAACWKDGYTNAFLTPNVTETGYSNMTDAVTPFQLLTARPWDSEIFNVHWKVAASHTIYLSPGSSHEHTSNYMYNQLITQERTYPLPGDAGSAYIGLGGITRNIMIVLRGMPVLDSTDNTRIQSGLANLNIMHETTYNACGFENNATSIAYADGTDTVTTGETITQTTENTTTGV